MNDSQEAALREHVGYSALKWLTLKSMFKWNISQR